MSRYILAIDDDPGRYDELRRLLEDRQGGVPVVLRVACCSACVAAHLPRAVAVLLDHDLSADPCTCGAVSYTHLRAHETGATCRP